MKLFFDARRYCLFSFALVALALITTAAPAKASPAMIADWEKVPYTEGVSLSHLEELNASETDDSKAMGLEATEEADPTETTSIPEPAAIALLVGGLGAMGLMRWRLG